MLQESRREQAGHKQAATTPPGSDPWKHLQQNDHPPHPPRTLAAKTLPTPPGHGPQAHIHPQQHSAQIPTRPRPRAPPGRGPQQLPLNRGALGGACLKLQRRRRGVHCRLPPVGRGRACCVQGGAAAAAAGRALSKPSLQPRVHAARVCAQQGS